MTCLCPPGCQWQRGELSHDHPRPGSDFLCGRRHLRKEVEESQELVWVCSRQPKPLHGAGEQESADQTSVHLPKV